MPRGIGARLFSIRSPIAARCHRDICLARHCTDRSGSAEDPSGLRAVCCAFWSSGWCGLFSSVGTRTQLTLPGGRSLSLKFLSLRRSKKSAFFSPLARTEILASLGMTTALAVDSVRASGEQLSFQFGNFRFLFSFPERFCSLCALYSAHVPGSRSARSFEAILGI